MSSPTVSWRKPPISTTTSFRNTPNAPETIISEPSSLQAARPKRNARRYSITCAAPSQERGTPTLVMPVVPPISQPFAIRTVPPAATVSAECGSTACMIALIASPSSTLSPSTTQT
jgi:hypothetical protein